MREFFNLDGPVFVWLNRIADIMILNIIFLVFCIPVVTIGASFTAMSYVTLKMSEGKEGYIIRSFWKSFRQNFRQSTIMWLILAAFGALLGVDFYMVQQASGTSWTIMQYIIFVGALIWVILFLYAFPLQARFFNPVMTTLRNALLVAFANAPRLILMIAVCAGAVVITLWNTSTFVWAILFWMVIGFALMSLLNSKLQIGIIHKLSGEAESDGEDPDHWEVDEN